MDEFESDSDSDYDETESEEIVEHRNAITRSGRQIKASVSRGGFRGGPRGPRPPLLLNNFFLSIPWMIEIVDFIQTSYSKNIIFV